MDSFQQLINSPLGPASLQEEFNDMNVSSQGLKAGAYLHGICYIEVQVHSRVLQSLLTHADL